MWGGNGYGIYGTLSRETEIAVTVYICVHMRTLSYVSAAWNIIVTCLIIMA
jgi:hypothetical protein